MSGFSDKQFTNYFRLNRSQFNEVQRLVQNSVYSEGCNAQKPIGTEEKLCVLKVSCFYFLYVNCLQKHFLQCYRISSILSRTFFAILVYLKSGCGLDSMALILTKFYLSIMKAVPLQACSCPEGSRKLRFPDFMTTAQDGGKVVSLTHRPPLPPGNSPGIHFC